MAGKQTIPEETISAICELVANGKTLTASCREHGVSPSAVRYRFMVDEQMFAISTRAREAGCDALADECIEIADDPTIDAAEKRVRIDTRIRLIGKWSKRYSDKLTVENNTTVTHKYDLDRLSDERLDELERILADAGRGEGDKSAAVTPSLH